MGVLSQIHTNGNGTPHDGGSGARTLQSYAPATGELLGEVRVSSREDVHAAIARARKAQAAWGVLPIEERCERLYRLRDALVERAEEIVDVVSRECGKPRPDCLSHEVMVT
ncbi:MAG TPA: aldehyde dehydrogenase family protein, partial [Labilithrix sp.]|nr:aldehyde dehydrogenase family protein [Labilithrix sp.]